METAAATAQNEQEVLNVGVQELLDVGMHFGHQSKRWNPKMKHFIFGKRNGIYIIDLIKSLAHLKQAQRFIYDVVAQGRSVLFVGTKKQCQEAIKETATRCGQHYVNSRWLGGTLTNHRNIRVSIKRMQAIEEMEQKEEMKNMPQKEVSRLRSELTRLQRFLSGLSTMNSMPGAMVIIDINREAIALKEANRMGIPVVSIVDTNCDPDPVDYPIPGNDDSSRAVRLVLNVLADAIQQAGAEYAAGAAQRQAEAAARGEEQAAKSLSLDDEEQEPHTRRSKRADRSERGERRPRRAGGGAARRGEPRAKPASDKSAPSAETTSAATTTETTAAEPAATPSL